MPWLYLAMAMHIPMGCWLAEPIHGLQVLLVQTSDRHLVQTRSQATPQIASDRFIFWIEPPSVYPSVPAGASARSGPCQEAILVLQTVISDKPGLPTFGNPGPVCVSAWIMVAPIRTAALVEGGRSGLVFDCPVQVWSSTAAPSAARATAPMPLRQLDSES